MGGDIALLRLDITGRACLNARSDEAGLGCGPRVCISIKLPDVLRAAGRGTTLGVSRAKVRISPMIYSWVGDTRALLYGNRTKERNALLSCQESQGGFGGMLEISGMSLCNVE